MRILGLIVGLALVIAARPAEACGAWKMSDKEKAYEIRWLINSGAIAGKRGRVSALYLDDEAGLKVVNSKKVIFDVKDGKVRKLGKAIGTINADGSITFGKTTYTVAFSNERGFHGSDKFSEFDLAVKRGDTLVIESKGAAALCAAAARASTGSIMTSAEQQDEIRTRVAFYLAWREVGL